MYIIYKKLDGKIIEEIYRCTSILALNNYLKKNMYNYYTSEIKKSSLLYMSLEGLKEKGFPYGLVVREEKIGKKTFRYVAIYSASTSKKYTTK